MNEIIKQLEMYYFNDVNLEYFFNSRRHQNHEDLKNYMFRHLESVMESDKVFSKNRCSCYLSFAHSIFNLLEDDDWKKLYANLVVRYAMGTSEA